MSKSVVDGFLKVLSPSLLSTFDETSAFGCMRKGYYKYVLGLKEPQTSSQIKGEQLHKANEAYLLHGKEIVVDRDVGIWFQKGRRYLDTLRSGMLPGLEVVAVEQPMPKGFSVEHVPVSDMSKCDVVTKAGIIDWKTTKSIEKYGKTPGELARDVQMLIYAKAFHPNEERVTLIHGQYQTEGVAAFREARVDLSREELDTNYERVITPLVATVRDVVRESKVENVKPVSEDRDDFRCKRCIHKTYCPTSKGLAIMSIFDRLKSQNAPVAPVVAQVSPPDAPASKPELAAKPVEGFQAVPPPRRMQIIDVPDPEVTAPSARTEEKAPAPAPEAPPAAEKRGPGRPRGSKNKVLATEVITYSPLETKAEPVKAVEKPEASQTAPRVVEKQTPVQFESVTVNYGLTLNLGNFSNVRIDVSMTARSPDIEAAYQAVLSNVQSKVKAEIEKVQAQVQLNPNAK